MSLLALSPSLTSLAPVLSASADGRQALVVRRGLVHFTSAGKSRSLMLAADVVATAVVDGSAWLVTADAHGHTLHRFSADARPQGPGIFLGELGEDITVTASPMAARAAAPLVVIEGRRGVLVRAIGEDVEVEELKRAVPVRRRSVTVELPIVEGSIGEDTGQVSLAALEAVIEDQAAELFAALMVDFERTRLESVGSCQ